ncbi:hypothetical protein HID58_024507 [Brassica napus]|uniref:DOG1 domain-containing protein n=2 Tax=Brassica TaxID=3705 RepID=A0ABQ7XGJ2_BRANA|nr:hypothetical protein HID58_024507 [Brassica napus]
MRQFSEWTGASSYRRRMRGLEKLEDVVKMVRPEFLRQKEELLKSLLFTVGFELLKGSMNSTSTHFVPPSRVGIYEPLHQFGMWGEPFKNNIGNGGSMNTPSHIIIPNNQKLDNNNLSEDTSHGTPHMFDQEASTSRHPDKIQRRLAQNREAARKNNNVMIFVYSMGDSVCRLMSSSWKQAGIAAFEMEYGHWIEEQNRQICELRTVLHGHVTDVELRSLVENTMKHYFELFRMKSAAAKADVFFVMSGMWRTSAERFFLWIGGFRPSDLLKVLLPHFDVMTDQQVLDVCNLRQSCQQAEDALSQGMEKLQHTLAECVARGGLGEGNYIPQVNSAMERLEALVSFVNQADHLRHETLQQMHRILTTRQAARGLLALGEYFQRLRALSSSWATRHPTMLSLSITSPGTAVTFLRGNVSANSTSSSFHGVRIQHQVSARVPISSSSRKPLTVMMSKREAELKEIRAKTTEELNEEVIDLKGELFMLRLQKSARNEFKSSEFRRMKKQVARILTVRREREIEEGIGKRLSRKLDRQWKKSIVVRPPPSLKKLQEEEAAEEAAEAAKSA